MTSVTSEGGLRRNHPDELLTPGRSSGEELRLWACVTTRNRPEKLLACLEALRVGTLRPYSVVVSDDSPSSRVQAANREITSRYPGWRYVGGPKEGVCANRNRALAFVPAADCELVAFVDDDVCVSPSFVASAHDLYERLSPQDRFSTILSGVSRSPGGGGTGPVRLGFRGYFRSATSPESVTVHASVFPFQLFEVERWDENIRFGYEDAELSLRARARQYQIRHCSELEVLNDGVDNSTLNVPGIGTLTDREVSLEAARLYVGVKRYSRIEPNPVKLAGFIIFTHAQLVAFLCRRRALAAWPEILRRSNVRRLLGGAPAPDKGTEGIRR